MRLALSLGAACVAASVVGGAATERVAAAPSAPIKLAGALEADETGVPAPAGIAFTSGSQTFHLIGSASRTGAQTEIVDVGSSRSFSGPKGRARIAALVSDPINVAFDPSHNRLLLVANARNLLEVSATRSGGLAPESLGRHNVSRLGLALPRGLAVDPTTGALFVLDAAQPRILRLDPAPGGSFEKASSTTIDLQDKGLGDVRGLAFDPSSRRLFLRGGTTLYELTTTGDVVSSRDLSGLDLSDPEGMVFAPSGDQTDAPGQQSLYVADSGGNSGGSGQIAELSLAPTPAAAAANFTSTVVRTTNTAAWNPPSPDPSGIAYVSTKNRLMISDGEVEEVVKGITHFQGANVWETTLSGSVLRTANISTVAPTSVPMTDEPTGVAFDPATGTYYFSDDNKKEVYHLNPGGDGLVGTSDDTWTSFDTAVYGDNDTEGIAYDPATRTVFTSDGVNAEVYEYTTTGTLLRHFDVQQYGVNDPETTEFDPASGTLFTLSNRQSGPIVVQTTTSGALLQTIDVSAMTAAGGRKPAGLAIAPASDGSGAMRFYVVDRGIDNNSNPNENDGKMFELTMPGGSGGGGNQAPSVDAGPDQQVTLPANASLNGTVSDDGNPNPPGTLTTTWSKTSGPGTVTFGDPHAVDTTASFSQAGTYVLRLTADDSALSSFDEVTITVSSSTGGDLIFADGFESGTLGAWSSATTGGGDLSVSSAAARFGTYGMQALLNDNTSIFVTDDTPAAEPRYRARFYFNPNGLAMAAGDDLYLLQGRNSAGDVVVRLPVRLVGSQYQVRGAVRQDGGSYTTSAWLPISSGWGAIEIDWRAATGAGANNGGLTIWIEGVQSADLSGIDNDTLRVDNARLGAVGVNTGTRGTVFFDAFESHRQSYIGP